MKKLVFKLFIFILPPLFIMWPLDLFLSYNYGKSNDYAGELEVWSDIYAGNIYCDVAIYGSSRAWVQVNPSIMKGSLNQDVYNFGVNGHNFRIQYLRHLEYIKNNKIPKQIILCLDVFSLEKIKDLYNPNQFLPYLLWNKNVREYTSSYNGFEMKDYYIPLIRYAGRRQDISTAIKNIFKSSKDSLKYRNKGYKGKDQKWNADLTRAIAEKGRYTVNFDPQTIGLFERFINECRELNINLVLVYPPEYVEGQKFISNRNVLIGVYKYFAKKHHLIFLDFSNDELCSQKDLFYNASHLNSHGADLFTSKLASDIKNKKTHHEADSIACRQQK